MMPDKFEHIERELRRFSPISPGVAVDVRIAGSLQSSGIQAPPPCRLNRGDRFLLGTLSTAAAALVVIVTLLGSDYFASRPVSPELSPTLAQTRHLLLQLASNERLNDIKSTTR
ncbi:MAG: hypothetical protein FWD53_12690 [Phycisphaerales bacterium]|nr:hypothetical protein [Phycisphaerales bacterium]